MVQKRLKKNNDAFIFEILCFVLNNNLTNAFLVIFQLYTFKKQPLI